MTETSWIWVCLARIGAALSSPASQAAAQWLSAIGTIGALLWGIRLIHLNRQERLEDRREATHEIVSASERIAVIWDKTAYDLRDERAADAPPIVEADLTKLMTYDSVIDVLLRRKDLSDGSIRCGVQSQLLVRSLRSSVEQKTPAIKSKSSIDKLQATAQDVLDTSRRLRNYYKISAPSHNHKFKILTLPHQ